MSYLSLLYNRSMALRIITFNACGLSDTIKQRAVFNYYRSRADVICLQETHCEDIMQLIWSSEWGGKILFSNGSCSSHGVCILFAKGIQYRICREQKDNEGRIIACELENIDEPDRRFTLCNIYAPNQDRLCFFVNAIKIIAEMSPNLVLISDFNLVMNTNVNCKGSSHNNVKARTILTNLMEDLSLIDIWRVRNTHKTIYSWMRAKPRFTASRLDYALISQGLAQQVDNPMYLPGIKSDHMAFYLCLSFRICTKGQRLLEIKCLLPP